MKPRLVRARLYWLRLPLATPLRSSHGVLRVREGALLELEDSDGVVGAGEALPLAGFALETPAQAQRALLERLPDWMRQLQDARDAPSLSRRLFADCPASRAALDVALCDLEARRAGLPLARWLRGEKAAPRVAINALLRGEEAGALAEEAAARVAEGFRTLKLKLGARPLPRDLERAAGLRRSAGAAPQLRFDANRGWDFATARRALTALRELEPEYVEEPLRPAWPLEARGGLRQRSGASPEPTPEPPYESCGAGADPRHRNPLSDGPADPPPGGRNSPALRADPDAAGHAPSLPCWRALRAFGIPLAADESLTGEGAGATAETLLRDAAADVLVVKPAALGGLRCSRVLLRRALRRGLGATVTSFLDSAVGRAAALHLAASLPELDRAAGVEAQSALRFDLASLPPAQSGAIALPEEAGLGVELDRAALRRASTAGPWELRP